ncbi:DUF3160 domain-containing protein [Candidatus Poribacteria bacterium]|nr:DUF3160 domain-containing protein [Candidatus Poribacteria bacterium]
MYKKTALCYIGIMTLFIVLSVSASAMPQIIGDVETDFAVYTPYTVDVIPNVPEYFTGPKLENVTNRDQFVFTDGEVELLTKNYFTAKPSQFKQVYDVYNYCQKKGIPIFVTTDSMLHTYHILFDYSLRILEIQRFFDDLMHLNRAMLEISISQYEAASEPLAKIAALKNIAYFTVANILLEPSTNIYPDARELVEAELQLIDAHEGGFPSPIFGYKEDYSQYVSRGHYTRNEAFKKYFRSMMWYGRMMFRLKPREGIEKAREETLQALLIVAAMNKDRLIDSEPLTDVWDRIYQPTVFFVGKSDDLNVYEYMELMVEIYGSDFGELTPDQLADQDNLDVFIEEALELRSPMINSSFLFTMKDLDMTKGFRFMGQRFIPDSYMFTQLVDDNVIGRYFPKGLDVMAVLGSQRAYDILMEVYNEGRYPKYTDQMEKLKDEFSSMDEEMWAQNLYWNWLYVLMSLLNPKPEGYPVFMRNEAWTDKELATALGSWAELRHDTILYAKQSYTVETSMPMGPKLIKGYVEPNPEFYARLAALARFTREGLSSRGLMLNEFKSKFKEMEELLLELKEISEIELRQNPISAVEPSPEISTEQYGLINNIGGILERITTFEPETAGQIQGDADEEMAIIADVHTDPNSNSVLEEGVGYPMNIFVIVSVDGGIRIAQGAMFAYYEFKWPMNNRLTDESWQEMLKNNPPDMPVWMNTFMDMPVIKVMGERIGVMQNSPWMPTEINVTISPELVEIGESITVETSIFGNIETPPKIILRQNNTVAESSMNKKPDTVFISEYIGSLDTSDFTPGMASITVRGKIGEEDVIFSKDLVLENTTAVHDSDDNSPENIVQKTKLRNKVYNAFPNPFNPDVWIPYEIMEAASVTVEIYNAAGQLVRQIDLGYKMPGRYMENGRAIHWDGLNESGEKVSSGMYFYRIQAGNFTAVGKMTAVK